MTVLIDTSAWVEYLRATDSRAAIEVRRLLTEEPHTVATCEPIAMELLSGALDDRTYATLERLFNGLPSLDIDTTVDFRGAASLYRTARLAGYTIRSINDCVIASLTIRHHAELLHRDADFEVLANLAPLNARSLR